MSATSSKSTASPQPKESIEQHLCEIGRLIVAAINERQFDADKPPWDERLDEKFNATVGKTFTAKKAGALNKVEYMEYLSDIAKGHPQHRIEIQTIDCHKDPGQGLAQLFLIFDITGTPPGLRRNTVAMLGFRRNAGNIWRCYSIQVSYGMPGAGGEVGSGH